MTVVRTGLSVVRTGCRPVCAVYDIVASSVCAMKAELIVSAVTVLSHMSFIISLLAMQLGVSDLTLLSKRVIGLCEIGICLPRPNDLTASGLYYSSNRKHFERRKK